MKISKMKMTIKLLTMKNYLLLIVFLTLALQSQAQTISDSDGNVYDTVTIGTQVWMKENLKTTKYNDGTPIPLVTDSATWVSLSTPAYCWYNNDEPKYKDKYGALYNWYTVNTGKLCPLGWHIPSRNELEILMDYLENSNVGGKLKETGTSNWNAPNTGATNETGFTALPGGRRWDKGSFFNLGASGVWWCSSMWSPFSSEAACFYMKYNVAELWLPSYPKEEGLSSRCIKDSEGVYMTLSDSVATLISNGISNSISKINVNTNTQWEAINNNNKWMTFIYLYNQDESKKTGISIIANNSYNDSVSRTGSVTIVGEGIASKTIIVKLRTATAVQTEQTNNYKISPNPASNVIYVEGVKSKDAGLHIYNSLGQLVLLRRVTNGELINISQLVSGFYSIVLFDGNETIKKKLIKQ